MGAHGSIPPQLANTEGLEGFPIQDYVGRGISSQQIIKVKQAFDSFSPVNGLVNTEKVKQHCQGSLDKRFIDEMIGNKKYLSFDDFFAIEEQLIADKLKKDPGVVIDANQIQATCFFCPYAEDAYHRRVN